MSKRRGFTLSVCCAAHAVQDGLTDVLYVMLPVLAQAFGLDYAQVGAVRAANRSAMAVFEMPSGMLSARFGERILLGFGLVTVGLAYLALATVNSYIGVLVCLGFAGLGAAFQHTLSSSVISKTFHGSARRVALGTYNSSGDVGKLVFAGLFTLLAGVGAAWQGLAAGFGLAALVAAGLVFALLRRFDAGGPPVARGAAEASTEAPGWGFRHPAGFAALTVIVCFDIAVQGGFLTFLAFLMIEKQVPVYLGAFAVVLTLFGGALGKLACGFLAARLGVIRSLVLVECLTAAGIVAVVLLPALPAFFLLPVVGAALQGSSTITYGTVSDLVEEAHQWRGFAILYSVANGAVILAPLGFGLIGDHYGLPSAMAIMAGLALVPLPLCLLLRPAMAQERGAGMSPGG